MIRLRLSAKAFKDKNTKAFDKLLDELLPWANRIASAGGDMYVSDVLTYLIECVERANVKVFKEKVAQHFSDKLRVDAMTIAEQLHQEGRQEGIHLAALAIRLFERGMDLADVANETGISIEELILLQNEVTLN